VSGVATGEAAPPPEAARAGSPVGEFFRRAAQGEFATVRVVLIIAVIWIIFQLANDRFLTAVNLSNLVLQIAGVATISIGVVLVLLLGEIDLSVGAVSGLAASVMAVLNVQQGWSPELAIVAGLATGAAIGLFTGFMVTTFGIPSFVVTLAGLIGWQGVQLAVLGETGTINLPDNLITDLTGTFFDPGIGWAIGVAVIVAYAASVLATRTRRVRAGLEAAPLAVSVGKIAVVAAAIIAAVAILNDDRGVPLAAVIMLGLMAIFSFLTTRTRWGRHLYAVGGNPEAARRAGIRINAVRITAFTLASTLAAAGGILIASRLLAVNQSSGGSDLLLLAIAGPVIAGTSLFGGRGFVWSALLGALVIGSISNGIDLVGLESDIRFMITGGVLLLAVTIDALTRLRRQTTGAG
jgi:D-xylose transport system permease protein